MNELWVQILENLSFIAGCAAIIVGLSMLAKLAEHFMPDMRRVSTARYVASRAGASVRDKEPK